MLAARLLNCIKEVHGVSVCCRASVTRTAVIAELRARRVVLHAKMPTASRGAPEPVDAIRDGR